MSRRLRECVERWPECYTFGYDPRCCRFPKSCSADVYGDETDGSLLEPAHPVATTPRKALVYKHPYLGILACCRECGDEVVRRDVAAGRTLSGPPESYLMLAPRSGAWTNPGMRPWDQGSLAAAHDVAHAHMRNEHPVEAR